MIKQLKAAALAGAMALLVAACASGNGSSSVEISDDPLSATNQTFRALYAENRLERLARSGHTIIVQFDDLILYRNGAEIRRAGFTPPLYHDLKSMAHIPLAVAVAYSNAVEVTADETWRGELIRLDRNLSDIDAEEIERRFPEGAVSDQMALLEMSRNTIAAMLDLGQPNAALLKNYADRVSPILLRNTDRAAQEQLNGLHDLVEGWRGDIGDAAWANIHVSCLVRKHRAKVICNMSISHRPWEMRHGAIV